MFNRKNHPPTQNQQTGQWHFYDDNGNPIDLKKKPFPHVEDAKPETSDAEFTCCLRRKK